MQQQGGQMHPHMGGPMQQQAQPNPFAHFLVSPSPFMPHQMQRMQQMQAHHQQRLNQNMHQQQQQTPVPKRNGRRNQSPIAAPPMQTAQSPFLADGNFGHTLQNGTQPALPHALQPSVGAMVSAAPSCPSGGITDAKSAEERECEETALHRAKITRIDAKIRALQCHADGGDDEAKSEIIDLQAARSCACEAITNMKKPEEKVRILT